jgi:hypothetical protein
MASVSRADAAEVDYLRDIKPLLKARCYACHGTLKKKARLRLDTAQAIHAGGRHGPAVTPGDAAASLLIERVATTDPDERMPPEGEPLSTQQIESLRRWIAVGAPIPTDEKAETSADEHWAFCAPRKATISATASSTTENGEPVHPIDALLEVERRRHDLKPLPSEDRRLLLRRVYLDLIGLPPTPEEQQEFIDDESTKAWESVVDRLLASPRHGERWGRHWMDVWRYTDWYGLGAQLRNSQKHLWHWRDWIVESLNDDKGYDRMVLEMLAGDELYPRDPDAVRGTGFLARNYYLFNRTTWLDATIEHSSKALLGLTMNCAKCHDHKYDPIKQVDYYRMRAFFEPHQVRLDSVPGETNLEKDGMPRAFDAHPDAPTYLLVRGDEKNPDKSRPLTPGVPEILAFAPIDITPIDLSPEAHSPALRPFVLEDRLREAEQAVATAHTSLAQARKRLAEAEARAAQTELTAVSVASTEPSKLVLADSFEKPRPDLWEIGPGDWKHRDGFITQRRVSTVRAHLRTRQNHPTDFEARLQFRLTGGAKWMSIGFAFDAVDGREKIVYMSAFRSDPKVQVAYKRGANIEYPPDGRVGLLVEKGQVYELGIAVRDKLVNVAVDGKHVLAYQLPLPREAGRLDVTAFDATVEFHSVELRSLPSDFALRAPKGKPGSASSVAESRLSVDVAEKTLTAAEMGPTALRTAFHADRARHTRPPPTSLDELILKASRAARQQELARAIADLAAAELKIEQADGKAKADAKKTRDAAVARVDKTTKAASKPSDGYTSLRASLKALEGPDETDASRRKPYPEISTGRRSALARWFVDPRHPLTARVAVNHIWMRHFGRPLVESVTDFGRRAPRPPQQALLDWLAVELIEHGWSMKHLHRLIVTSAAYRLSGSTLDADDLTRRKDHENTFYWKRTPTRMESEVIRDSLLQLAGVLDHRLGGPTIDPRREDKAFRRSLYFTRSRDHQHPFLSMFDDANILACYRRTKSVVPQQALTLANSKLALGMARRIAARITARIDADETPSDRVFVAEAFETVLTRRPSKAEVDACLTTLADLTDAIEKQGGKDPRQQARQNLAHALINHNDFITIR